MLFLCSEQEPIGCSKPNKDVATDWDDTKILEAEPGDYLTIARKEKTRPDDSVGREKENWFVGAITDEQSRTVSLSFEFLTAGATYEATIYRDADNTDWKTNPEAYTIEKIVVTNETKLTIKLAKGGGFAVSVMRK